MRGPAYGGPGDDVDAAEPGDACIETAGVVARDGALPGRRSPERPHESELPAATTRAIRELSRKARCEARRAIQFVGIFPTRKLFEVRGLDAGGSRRGAARGRRR